MACPSALSLLFLLGEQVAGSVKELAIPLAHLDGVNRVIGCDLLDRLAALINSMATRALNSGLWVRRLLNGGSPCQGAVSTPPQSQG